MTALASVGGKPETLYVGTARSGVVRSTDEGRSWIPASGQATVAPACNTVLALAIDPADRRTVYVGTGDGLAKSTDSGATWAALPYPGDNALAVAVSPANPKLVLGVASSPRRQGLVYRSEDGGLSWGRRP